MKQQDNMATLQGVLPPDGIKAQLEKGLAFHRSGQLAEAQACYRGILETEPRHFSALHLSALVAYQSGALEMAESYFLKALEVDATIAPVHSNYGLTLQDLKRYDDALGAYDKAISLKPDYARAYYNRASALHELARFDEAVASYDQALLIEPDYADAYNNRGLALHKLQRYAEAMASFDQSIAVKPDSADAFYNRGNALQDLNRHDEAVASYAKALEIRPDHAEAFSQRGNALQILERFEDAIGDYDKAISLKPDHAAAYYNRGVSLLKLERLEESIISYDKAILLKPDYVDAYNNRGNALQRLKRFDEAIASYDQAIAIMPDNDKAHYNRGGALQVMMEFEQALLSYEKAILISPDYVEAHNNRGNIFQHTKRVDEAIESYDRVLAINPDRASARMGKGFALLSKQQLLEGWKLYEWRKKLREPYGDRTFGKPLWLGAEDISGKTILVHFEQGLGDTIQFCRYLPFLNKLGARVLFASQKSLRGLLRSFDGGFTLVDEYDPTLEYDHHIPLLSLPLALYSLVSGVPAQDSYLRADEDRVKSWKAKLGEEGFKIGVCWQGSQAKIDIGRSFPLAKLHSISQLPGVRLISLHKGDGEPQLKELPDGMKVETLGENFDAGADAFLDTAAVMKCCDLVISSDTAVAHVAGALGVPTWIALKYVPDWRWFIDREDSPWYPSLRLFRQPADGDWDRLFRSMEESLRAILPGSSAIASNSPATVNDHKAVFDRIYDENRQGDVTASGSTPDNTGPYRAFLANFLKTNGIKSVVDIGCGDWRFSRLIDWSGVQYTGLDVSSFALQNARTCSAENIRFLELNALEGDLPEGELLLMKDVLQHWSNEDINSFLPRLKKYERALITNGFHPARMDRLNADIRTGGQRPIDLKAPPFNLDGDYVYWWSGDEPEWVFLWKRTHLAHP